MALSPLTVWEVNSTGNDANGGGFVVGSSGIDKTYVPNGLYVPTTHAALATQTTATQVASSTPFVASDVGNLINIAAATGWTAGFYQIVSVASGIATLDRAPAAASTSGGTGVVGGALATPQAAANGMVAGNRLWIRYGTYGAPSSSAPVLNLSNAVNVSSITNTQPPTWISGYYQTRGDLGYGPKQASLASKRPTLQLATTSTATNVVNVGNASNVLFENLIADANNVSGGGCFNLSAQNYCRNCLSIHYANVGFNGAGNSGFEFCEATASTSGFPSATGFNIYSGNSYMIGCHAHDGGIGVNLGQGCFVWRCLIANNASWGVNVAYLGYSVVAECSIVNNANTGVYNGNASVFGLRVCDCVIEGNIGFGYLACSAAGFPTDPMFDGNAYYNNVSGAIGGLTSGGLTGVPAYTNQYDVLSSAELLNNPVDLGDFGLNNANPGGAQARGATWISQWPLNSAASGLTSTTNRADLGAAQSLAGSNLGTTGGPPRPFIVRPTTHIFN